MTTPELRQFLVRWRADLQHELRTNENKCLSRCHPSIARCVTDSFPAPNVLRSYSNPVTSSLPMNSNHIACNLDYSSIDVPRLAALCEIYFNWGEGGTGVLAKKFRNLIWPGVVTRLMLLNRTTVCLFLCAHIIALIIIVPHILPALCRHRQRPEKSSRVSLNMEFSDCEL